MGRSGVVISRRDVNRGIRLVSGVVYMAMYGLTECGRRVAGCCEQADEAALIFGVISVNSIEIACAKP